MQKYSINNQTIQTLLTWVQSGDIAIPEIQRPFVWDSSKVRDFIDSLHQGYPVGYVISWTNPDVRLKDGSKSRGKKVLIDGQQRITALTAAILGNYVLDKNYKKTKIKIAFNPILEKFEVLNPAISKDRTWIPDISEVINNSNQWDLTQKYLLDNPGNDGNQIGSIFSRLMNILTKQIGVIELSHDLDIETVTEIFIRINSKGVVLSQADFAMSKIASNIEYGGNLLRKTIDYFCHASISPEFLFHIKENDPDFSSSDSFKKIEWLKNENEDLYDPKYTDLIRVAFTFQFNRGKLSDLVSLLSGRNFETRTFEATIAEKSYEKLKCGVDNFINETNFKRFLLIIKSAGFISSKLIRSQNALNFAYILYLKLREKGVNSVEIERYVRRWFVYSILTGRYSGSAESNFEYDIKQIENKPFSQFLQENEDGGLSDSYWEFSLPQSLDTSVASSPYFNVFIAAQIRANDHGFLSRDVFVNDLVSIKGDIHHLFPKDYLKKHGLSRSSYNQIANYVFMQSEINIKVGNKAPKDYLGIIISQLRTGEMLVSGIESEDEIRKNLDENCVPQDILEMDISNYDEFLTSRRRLIALKLKNYYFSL